MAKGKNERRRRAKSPADSPPAEQPSAAGPAPVAADDVADDVADDTPAPEPASSRRQTLVVVVVVAACAAATGLLLSGWTPGPGSPQGTAAPAPATTRPAAKPAPAKKVRRKTRSVRKRPITRKEALARARNVSRDLFSNECGVCHTLAAAGTTGLAGPNLDKLRPTRARVLAAIRNGGRGSGLMSPNLVVGNDAARIAQFVATSTHR